MLLLPHQRPILFRSLQKTALQAQPTRIGVCALLPGSPTSREVPTAYRQFPPATSLVRTFLDKAGPINESYLGFDKNDYNVSARRRKNLMRRLGLSDSTRLARPSTWTDPRPRRQRLPPRTKKQMPAVNIFPMSAIHIAQTIDIFPVLSTVFSDNSVRKQMFGKNSFVVELKPLRERDPPRYAAIFRFGSVVCLNVSPSEVTALLSNIKRHALEPVLSGVERKEMFGVIIKEQPQDLHTATEEEPFVVTGDYCIVPKLDMNGFAVISNIMAQSVALDNYNDTVDDLLANFAKINATVTKTGSFPPTDMNFLFKTVAQNNSIFIDMISKIRIKDRSDTAWNMTEYEKIHYGKHSWQVCCLVGLLAVSRTHTFSCRHERRV